jgi:hypothetical protein
MSDLEALRTQLDAFAARQRPGSEMADIAAVVKRLYTEATSANRRAMTVQKELRLPLGTIVISPETGTYGVIGKDGMIDPASVKPLNPHAFDAVGGVFYTPSARPIGSDGSGQSLIGPGFVGKSDRFGIGAVIAQAHRNATAGTLSVETIVKEAQAEVREGVAS